MKKNTLLILFFIALIKFTSSAQTTYTWNGSTSTAWNTNTNWTPNGVPTSADNAVIVTGANNCILAANTTITNLTITSGLLNLNGFTLNTTGVVACNSGTCSNGTFNSTATQLTFAGTLFNADVTANVTEVYFNGSTFNGSVTVSKNGILNASSTGSNTFNGITSISNAGTGNLVLTNGVSGRIDVFNAPATFSTSNTGNLYIGYNRSMDINANVFVNNASTGQVYLGNNATSTVNLNSGITITCGAFTDGALRINRLVQTGSTALNLLPGSAGAIHINNSVINGSLTVDAGLIIAQTSTFATAVNYSVSGTIMNNWSNGGNVYNGVLTVNNSSNGYFGFANGTPDTYNDDVYAYNTSTTGGRIIFSNNCTSQFNGNLYVSQTGNISGGGIAVGWSGTYPLINFAAGKSVIINGTYNSGYLQLYRIQQTDATPFNITASGNAAITLQDNICLGVLNVSSTETVAVTLRDNVFHAAVTVSLTDNSSAVLRENISHGAVTVSSPNLYPQGGTYNAPVVFTKTGGGGGNHNSGYQNIFNSTLEVNNQNGGGYLMLSYQSNDQFNDDITVSSTGTATGISFGWDSGTGTPVVAAGKSIFVGAGGYTSGYLRLGSFTQLGNAPINLTLTGTAYLQVLQPNIPCTFGGAFNITAPDIYIRGGVFNGAAEFTKTGGVDNHNNGNSNTFNSTCTINQQSTTGYFMLGYNSADIFNDDITVTNTGSRAIQLGWTGGTGSLTLATGKTVKIGAAGFSGSILYFGGFTQLGNAPVNLPLTGTATTLSYRSSTFGGNINSTSGNLTLNGSTFNGTFIAEKTGSASDDNPGGNTFNGICDITNNGTGYFSMGNGSPDVWNDDATFTNNSAARLIYLARGSAGNIFAGNLTLNSTGSASGINICSNGASTATLFATKTIITNTFTSGYLSLPRFTQLGNAPVTLSLTSTADYLQYGPNSTFGGNVTSASPRLLFHGCTFNGTTDCTKTGGGTGDYSNGGNVFNGVCNITNNGTIFLLLGYVNPDVWNDDVTFTNNSTDRILPAHTAAGNIFNGNIYVNTSGGGTGISFCNNAAATATLVSGKTIASGTVGLNSGYLILQRFTQLGNAPVTLGLTSTASYLQFGPSSELGGNVISVSPRVLFRGCTFLGTTNCTKTGSGSDNSSSSNTFSGTAVITNYGGGTMYFGDGSTDAFMSAATFNNLGTSDMYVAHNSSSNVFGGVVTFSNAPSGGNVGIHISRFSVGTVFNEDIIVSNTGGSGVWFCGDGSNISNATISTVTLSAGKTISIGSAGFNAGRLMLKQFTQLGATAQTLSITAGTASLQLGPSSRFDGAVDFNFPRVQLHGATYNGVTTITKNGASDETGNGGNVFNGTTTITNSGSGYLYTGNGTADQFNGVTTMNSTGSDSRIYFAHNHNGQTTTFTQPLTLNAAKTGGADTWSYLISEGTNSHVSFDDVTMNIGGTLQSNLRILQGTGATATYNGNLTINLSNTFASGTQIQLGTGTNAVSNYNGNIILNSTTGVAGSGIYFNTVASASSTLASTKSIGLGGSGFTSGNLSIPRFTQLGTATQSLVQTSGTALLTSGPSNTFNGPVDFNFPQINLTNSTYNNTAVIEKNGATVNLCTGNNTFNGTTTITNSHATDYLRLANSTADTYNGDVTFVQTTAGLLQPNYNTNCTYAGNITVSAPTGSAITFGTGGSGRATLTGGAAQTINRSNGEFPNFTRLTLNKSGSDVTLNTSINVINDLTFANGIMNSSPSNILVMKNASSTTIGSGNSHINGAMDYEMATNSGARRVLNFPIGNSGEWRPVVLQVSHNTTTNYTYRADVTNADAHALGWAIPGTITHVSHAHYWDIERRNTTTGVAESATDLRITAGAAPIITLYYDANDGVTDAAFLTVCKNTSAALTTWIDIGGTGASNTTGNVTSTSAPAVFNSFSRFTLGNKINGLNPLPIKLLYFTAVPVDNKTVRLDWATASEKDNHHFEIERSIDGINFENVSTVPARRNGNSSTKQDYSTNDEKPYKGISYYRLKQVDKSGGFNYAKLVDVSINSNSTLSFYPNPASNYIYFSGNKDLKHTTVKVLNSLGALVIHEMNLSDNGMIDVSNLAEGIYYIQVSNQGEMEQSVKISVQK